MVDFADFAGVDDEADGLEDAGGAVGAEGGDAHLGHDFHEAFAKGGDVVGGGAVGGVGGEGGDGGEGEPVDSWFSF